MNLNQEHRVELVRGLASAASLAGLLVGVPILLIAGVGWPLPAGIPSGSEALTALKTGAVPLALILKPISLVVWVLWLQMSVGLGVELWAHFQGRVAPRVSFIPSFMQRLAARLISTVLVIAFSIQHPGSAMADNQELLAPTILETNVGSLWGLESDSEDTPATSEGVEGIAPGNEPVDAIPLIHTVERRDSLRLLAQRYLGDPNRWTEVFVLNEGQAQANGGSLTDPARLQPGWELVMPADARLPEPEELKIDETPDARQQPEAALTDLDDLSVTVREGDTLWDLAAHHLNDPERWIDIVDSNQDIIQDPDMILPGWELQIPVEPAESTAAEPPTHPLPGSAVQPASAGQPAPKPHPLPEPAGQPPSAGQPAPAGQPASVAAYATAKPTVVASVPPAKTERRSLPNNQTMFAIGGLGVFASSLGWVLARLRRTQRRRMPDGRMPLPPSTRAVQMEQQLQAVSNPESALFLDAALRVMSSRVAGNPPPDIIGVTLEADRVSVHLNSPEEAPPGFHSSEDKLTWTLLRGAVLEDLLAEADGVPAPLPTLATVGTQDGNECLLNLEHTVALSLKGDSEAIVDLCSAMAVQLASSHLADDLTVMCVGFGHELTVFERIEHVPDVASAIERIEHQHRQNHALLGSHPSLIDSRIGNSGDFWHPMVALVPNRLDDEEASRLVDACGSSVCAVANELHGAAWVGQFDEHGLLLQPIGLRLTPHGLPEIAVAAFTELASTAKDVEGVVLSAPPTTQPIHLHDEACAEGSLNIDIEIRVMGTVDVLGAAQPFTSRRALDLVAYLAFHPEGADRDQLRAQIWPPDDPPSESTLANTVSRARKALGFNDDGEPYLPRVSQEGIYRLRPEVGTDVSRFEALVHAGRDAVGERGRQHLQSALDLVRGTPFTGGAGDLYRWADFGLRTQIDCLVDTAAHELAKRCIDAGEFQEARRAVMTSLRLVGVCEECYRWRLKAAAENPTEVRQVMSELMDLLRRERDQPEADDLISPDLLELYEQLMSGRVLFR